MRILVTGAASPLGRVVVQQLAARGHRVVGLARRLSGIKVLQKLGADPFRGDVRRPDHVARAVAGCDTVVHLAGFFDFWEPTPGTYDSVNVDGVRQALAAARAAAVKRFVLVSSAITVTEAAGRYGNAGGRERAVRSTALERSKLAAEQLAMRARRNGLEVVLVNPGLVVAPGDPGWLGRLIGATVSGQRPLAAHAPLAAVAEPFRVLAGLLALLWRRRGLRIARLVRTVGKVFAFHLVIALPFARELRAIARVSERPPDGCRFRLLDFAP